MGFWQTIRNWIDGDDAEHGLEDMMVDTKPGSPSMQFIVRVVDAIRADLVSGTYIPSTDNAAAYFPPIYTVFLSESDIKNWSGERLAHFQSRVAEGVMRKIGELDKKKTAQTVQIEVKRDGTLNPGQIRVQSLSETSKTKDGITSTELPTVPDTTTVLPTLYSIEVYDDNRLTSTHKIVHGEIYIGRHKNSHIRLEGDDRIGREHASLIFEDGQLILSALNENPIQIGSDLLAKKQKRTISDGDKVVIYNFTLIPRL